MFKSVNDARYTMWATVITRLDSTSGADLPTGGGQFEAYQDPDSLQVLTRWIPADLTHSPTAQAKLEIPCYARGYTNLGFRSSANREVYVQELYDVVESIQFDYPAWVTLNHQSFITNIRTREELDAPEWLWTYEDSGNPIVWEVQGTTPVTDPFGKLLRYTTVLKRSKIQ